MYNWMAFIDFDGTITSEETLSGALKLLHPPGLEETVGQMLAGKLTLSAGLRKLFSQVPSARYGEIDAYIQSVPLRKGFNELLAYCNDTGIPVVVLSGGITQMLQAKLEPYRELFLAQHSVWLDLSGEYMRMVSDYDDGVQLVRKTLVMERYEYKKAICIGDSYTDFDMAKKADVVFARDELATHLEQSGLSFFAWTDFYDIINILKSKRIPRENGLPADCR